MEYQKRLFTIHLRRRNPTPPIRWAYSIINLRTPLGKTRLRKPVPPPGSTTQLRFDPIGRRVATIDALGNRTDAGLR